MSAAPMNAGDYQKLKDIFQSAVEIPPDERPAFLDKKCNGNNDLRAEVERLLNSIDDEFLEKPAVEPITGDAHATRSRSGQHIGHYEVVRRIGSGGMGDVYLAVDGKLGRHVAVKILPEDFTADESRLDRFRLEARAASSLSHPNILTIYEVGEWEGTHYMATEYVDGETLRNRLSRERPSIAEAMDLGIQLALAIAAAHEAAICHRDIKPENIMIRRDGLLKVVDFGLAKLVASPFRTPLSPPPLTGPTVKIVNTEPGVIMGTVQYMSPEQTRGLATDERSDIWSVGCVLYEMLTGHAPFKGDTSADMVAEIVKTHPELPSRLSCDVPERLDEIISKSLEKNPDERYQTAKDLLIDLKRLRRNLELEDTLERSNPRITSDSGEVVISGPNIISTRKGPKDLTEVNSAQYLYWGMKAHRWTTVGITLFVIGLVGGTAMLVRTYWRDPPQPRPAVESYEIERITSRGRALQSAVSPDGKFIAVFDTTPNEQSLRVIQAETRSEIQAIPTQKAKNTLGLQFSNDGNYLYYVMGEGGLNALYRIPSLGGAPQRLIEDVDIMADFSHREDRIAFIRWGDKVSYLMTAEPDGSNVQTLLEHEGERSILGAAWSPDGERFLLLVREKFGLDTLKAKLKIFSLQNREISTFIEKVWSHPGTPVWDANGATVIFTAQESKDAPRRIWRASYPSGQVTPVTNDFNSYQSLTTTRDGKTTAAQRVEIRTSIWSLDLSTNQLRQITSESQEQLGFEGIAAFSNGDLLVTKQEVDRINLWRLAAPDFKTESRLTNEKATHRSPAVTRDGKYIVYAAGHDDLFALWRVNDDGTGSRQLTEPTGGIDGEPVVLGDNKTVLFVRTTDGFETRVLRVFIEGGVESEVLSEDNTYFGSGFVSLDGRLFGTSSFSWGTEDSGNVRVSLRFLENRDGLVPVDKRANIESIGTNGGRCKWVYGSTLACFGETDPANLYRSDPSLRKFSKLTDFDDGFIWRIANSLDGNRIFLVRVFLTSDVYLLKRKAANLP